jgi:hypothetical protein
VAQLLRKFSVFHETQRNITVFIKARCVPSAEKMNEVHSLHTSFFNVHYSIIILVDEEELET